MSTKRMSISLNQQSIEDLEYLSNCGRTNQNECIRLAIATDVYIRKHCILGAKILLQNVDGSIIEVVFR